MILGPRNPANMKEHNTNVWERKERDYNIKN